MAIRIITTKEAVEEMVKGRIVKTLDDNNTFFVHHKDRDMIYMLYYDEKAVKLCINTVATPKQIIDQKNGYEFLRDYSKDKFIIATFFDIFNEMTIPHPDYFFGLGAFQDKTCYKDDSYLLRIFRDNRSSNNLNSGNGYDNVYDIDDNSLYPVCPIDDNISNTNKEDK